MSDSMNDKTDDRRTRTRLGRIKAYFGFAEPGLTWRQRCRIFLSNERRSWARLLGSRRPEDACDRNIAPPSS